MKFAKSILILIVASTVSVNKCTGACDSVINIKSTSGSTTTFNYDTFALTDTATALKSTPFTCADSKTIIPITDTTYSVICIADPEPTEKPDSSSANTLVATSAVLFSALLSVLFL